MVAAACQNVRLTETIVKYGYVAAGAYRMLTLAIVTALVHQSYAECRWQEGKGWWHGRAQVIDQPNNTSLFSLTVRQGKRSAAIVEDLLPGLLSPIEGESSVHIRAELTRGGRLLVTSAWLTDWCRTSIRLWTDRLSDAIWISHRDDPEQVLSFQRKGGQVTAFAVYDRWIGGTAHPVRLRGVLLSRREEVSTYRIMGSRIERQSRRVRLIESGGGGACEKVFVWEKHPR